MAEDKVEVRDINYRQTFPWVELFRGFQVALDPKKLLLAAAGIVVMSVGWCVLSLIFFASSSSEPNPSDYPTAKYLKGDGKLTETQAKRLADNEFKSDHDKWQLLYETAGPGGTLSSLPWDEYRGPNPYLIVTGQERPTTVSAAYSQGKVLIEPLIKFLRPIKYLLDSRAGFWDHVYFLLVLLWTIATWALFGGAITRMAAVQLARKEKISLAESIRFTLQHYLSFFSAPLFPLLFVVLILVGLVIFGILHLIPVVGDVVVDGVFWPLVLLAGLVMAITLVGLAGWPLMYATISTEGSDSFDALSRSYSYVYQCPWHYLWNSVVAIAYGAALVFFVGFMGSLTVYMGKWGVGQTPFVRMADREPSYLFVYAPMSYEWRQLLLQGSPAVDANGFITEARYDEFLNGRPDPETHQREGGLRLYNKIGARLVACWLYLVFLVVVGFGYSYFWSASTIIYLLMRRKVDETDLDEIYLEEDETDDAYATSVPAPPPSATAPTGTPLAMVEPPAPTPPPPHAESTPAESVTTPTGDGNPSASNP